MNVLNLGAGVQSTCLYLMAADDDPEMRDYPVDVGIFADTGDEPDAVYRHIDWLQDQGGPPILVRKLLPDKSLSDTLVVNENSTGQRLGQRLASIPAYTRGETGGVGQVRRQCTREWKIDVVERTIKRELWELEPRKRVPPHLRCRQYMGFSLDEPGRAARARGRFDLKYWASVAFPLIELEMTRTDCELYLRDRVPHEVHKSACVYCPYKSNREWRRLKENDPIGWKKACDIDERMRAAEAPFAKGLDKKLYVHRSGRPLRTANLDENQGEFDFMAECEGGCGL